MNYRHAYHAGNFADVVKHVALVSILEHLKKKDKPFCVVDTHAGRGLYDLSGTEAARTGEAAAGVGSLLNLSGAPGVLGRYLDCIREEEGGYYPGSPRLTARLLRPQDRLVAIEKLPGEAEALARALAPFPNAKALAADSYERLPALLPPRERRGLVLIDPPYEADDEFARAADLLVTAHRRFATGIYLLWFPIKSKAHAEALSGEILSRGVNRALRVDVAIGEGVEEQLSAAGLLVVNPPFGFEKEMRDAADLLAPRLGRTDQLAAISLSPLGG